MVYSEMTPYGELINILSNECKKLIRLRENIIKKIINAELSITFNETCIRENLLPAYTLNIYIYIYIYRRLGGESNREIVFVSFVRACVRAGEARRSCVRA